MQLDYKDADLRDLSESWVCINAESLTSPKGEPLKGRQIVGYLTIDRHAGFRVLVEGEVTRNAAQRLAWRERWIAWQLDYVDLRALSMGPLSIEEVNALGLPERPWGMPARAPSEVLRCRNCRTLDPMRAPGHPDVVRIWIKVGDNCRGESVLARLETETYPDVYHCTLLSPPSDGRYAAGTRVIVAHFVIRGEKGLYCAWEA
jgi:hypothetical protein